MFKVKGNLDNGKTFKLDARANTIVEAARELEEKLNGIDAEVVRVSFTARGATIAELELNDAPPKRERKPSKKRNGKKTPA